MTSHHFTALALLWLLCSCQVTQLESVSGRHVVVHWDPDENQLCDGTLVHVDATLEVVAQTYGISLPAVPNTEIMWTGDRTLYDNACWGPAAACNLPLPNGTNMLLTDDVIHLHELTHTVDFTGKNLALPSFFAEGVAKRWEKGLGPWAQSDLVDYAWDVNYSEVLALFERWRISGEYYGTAGFLWSWLEAEFGPHAMREFASRVDIFSSPAKIEREFEATFGITLKMATEASRGQPLTTFDPHPCSMAHLPTFVWADEPLVLSDGPSTCATDDVVNDGSGGAARYARLELPEARREYTLELTGPVSGAGIHFFACTGEPQPYEDPIVLTPFDGNHTPWLGGTYIVIVTAPLEKDGHVPFPTATLKP